MEEKIFLPTNEPRDRDDNTFKNCYILEKRENIECPSHFCSFDDETHFVRQRYPRCFISGEMYPKNISK